MALEVYGKNNIFIPVLVIFWRHSTHTKNIYADHLVLEVTNWDFILLRSHSFRAQGQYLGRPVTTIHDMLTC